MYPFQFDSDMSDVSTTPVIRITDDIPHLGDLAPPQLVRYPDDLTHLGDLTPLPLVRQHADPRDPLDIAIEVDYIPVTTALSSDPMDVDPP